MESNQTNYEVEQEMNTRLPEAEDVRQAESKLPLMSAIFSGLTLVVVIVILIITLMNGMNRPTMMGNGGMPGIIRQGEELQSFSIEEGPIPIRE